MHDDVSVNTGFFDQLQDNKDSSGSHAYHELAEAALKLQNKNPRSVRAIVYNYITSLDWIIITLAWTKCIFRHFMFGQLQSLLLGAVCWSSAIP